MKKLILPTLLFCLTSFLLAQDSTGDPAVSKYDSLFDEINEIRVGVLPKDIKATADPFITPTRPSTGGNATKLPPLILNAIVENQKVLINDKWYELKSRVYGLRLSSIKDNSVTLTGKNRSVELYLRKEDENSIIKSH